MRQTVPTFVRESIGKCGVCYVVVTLDDGVHHPYVTSLSTAMSLETENWDSRKVQSIDISRWCISDNSDFGYVDIVFSPQRICLENYTHGRVLRSGRECVKAVILGGAPLFRTWYRSR